MRGRFSFYAFRAAGDSTEPCARFTLLLLRFGLLFHDALPAVGPLPDRKDGVGQMNAA